MVKNGLKCIFSTPGLKEVLGAWQTPFHIQTFAQGLVIRHFAALLFHDSDLSHLR